MDEDRRFDNLVEPLRRDTVSGASDVSGAAADVLRRAAVRLRAGSLEELLWGMGGVSRRVLEAQPAMAPLVALVRDVLDAIESAGSLEEARLAAAGAAEAFRAAAGPARSAIAEHALPLLPAAGRVATVSSSATVRVVLEAWAGRGTHGGAAGPASGGARPEAEARARSVLCFESRPGNEGRGLAAALAEAGVPVTYAVDAAADRLTSTCAAVVLGADSVGDRGVVNKIGSTGLARSAAALGVPVYVLADRTKILPRGFAQPTDDERPAAEAWDAPRGVRVWNQYFEAVPPELVTALVTEDGVHRPADLEALRDRVVLPDGLRSWAAGRG